MPQYRKKPVVIEAEQYQEWKEGPWPVFFGAELEPVLDSNMLGPNKWNLKINTLEGPIYASPGDWIIKGIKGELYPCKPEIFEASYELVS